MGTLKSKQRWAQVAQRFPGASETILQFSLFGLIGVVGVAINYSTFLAFLWVVGVHYEIASLAGYLMPIPLVFWANRKFTFQSRGAEHRKEFAKYVALLGFSLGLNLILIYLLVEQGGLAEELAQAYTQVVVTLTNFTGSKLWVFPATQREA